MAEKRGPSNADLVYDVMRSAEEPLTFQEIFDRVNQRQPVTTKNPKATLRSAVGAAKQIISLGDGRYGYLPYLVRGSLLRLPLTGKKPADHPLTYSDEHIQALWPSFFESQKRKERGPIVARLPNGVETRLSLDFVGPGQWGCPLPEPLRRYLVDQRAAEGDALLIRVVGGEPNSCEISREPRLNRDKEALAARNNELADAAARIFHERGSVELAIWDLVILLLARGTYRSEPAPDPLDTILRDDRRFEYAGLRGWALAEAMTPGMRAEIREREQTERELLGAISGADDEPGPLLSPLAGRAMLERTLADIGALLAEQEPGSIEEMNALLRELMSQGGVPRRQPSTPLEQAQELIYRAHETGSGHERVRLARRALEISPDCADAYVLLAEETARTPRQAADLYAQGVAAAERALGPEIFEDAVGSFWGILETRPYMRARLGLAQALWALGDQQATIAHARDMLRLNPGDNQGVRYVLLNWLLQRDDSADAIGALFDEYDDDVSAVWTYGRALAAFRREGDTASSRRLRAEARKWNPHVPAYLAGKKRLPRQLPGLIGMGDESEAIYLTAEQGSAWRTTPGAIDWVNSGPR